jgi:hypothetical protein
MRDEEMNAEIEDFIEGFNQPTYCGMRVNGVRVATWSSRDGWSGDTRLDAEWLQQAGINRRKPDANQSRAFEHTGRKPRTIHDSAHKTAVSAATPKTPAKNGEYWIINH